MLAHISLVERWSACKLSISDWNNSRNQLPTTWDSKEATSNWWTRGSATRFGIATSNCTMMGKWCDAKAIFMREATSCNTFSQSVLVRTKSICPKLAGINAEHGLEPILSTVTCRLVVEQRKCYQQQRPAPHKALAKVVDLTLGEVRLRCIQRYIRPTDALQ